MSVTWKINGTDVATLGLQNLVVTFENQRPDVLAFEDTSAEFDAALRYAIDAAITLTRTEGAGSPVTWFKGVIRQTPRTGEVSRNSIGYVAEGPWQWLERIMFLQNFTVPTDASNVSSSLTTYLRGRAVVAQDDTGAKVNLGVFLNSVLDYAITASTAYVGSAVITRDDFSAITGLQITIPWDEVVDLSCAEVVSRVLQFVPDAVTWWDYTAATPKLYIKRRAALTSRDLALIPASASWKTVCRAVAVADVTLTGPGATLDGVTLATGDRILLTAQATGTQNGIYVFAGAASSLVRSTDCDAAGEFASAVVVVAGGDVYGGSTWAQVATVTTLATDASRWLQVLIDSAPTIRERPDLQRSGVVLIYTRTNRANEAVWETREIDDYPVSSSPSSPAVLTRTIALAGGVANQTILTQKIDVDPITQADLVFTSPVTSGSQFTALSTWWKNHAPELRAPGITLKAFRNGTRTKDDGTSYTVACARELVKGAITDWMMDNQGIDAEQQLIAVEVAYEITDPDDATRKENVIKQLSAIVTATSAQTQTYSFTAATSYTPAEATPTGLARAIYDAISVLVFDGRVQLTERDPTLPNLLGYTLNLFGGLAAWKTMAAHIQRHEVRLDSGRTLLTFGPPKQLGPDDLVELYRVNRNRQPVTSYMTRATGKSGTSDSKQGLTRHHPAKAGGTGGVRPPRLFSVSVSPAGAVPTPSEIATALAAAYTGTGSNVRPIAGDQVIVTKSSVPKFCYHITTTNVSTSGLNTVSFTVASNTYYGVMGQVGIY